MSEYTSGPWEAVGSTVRTLRTDRGGGLFVADCWRRWEDPQEFAFDGREADANARLIAEAPKMLEALKMVRSVISNSEHWWMDCPDKSGFDCDLINTIFSKAEG